MFVKSFRNTFFFCILLTINIVPSLRCTPLWFNSVLVYFILTLNWIKYATFYQLNKPCIFISCLYFSFSTLVSLLWSLLCVFLYCVFLTNMVLSPFLSSYKAHSPSPLLWFFALHVLCVLICTTYTVVVVIVVVPSRALHFI